MEHYGLRRVYELVVWSEHQGASASEDDMEVNRIVLQASELIWTFAQRSTLHGDVDLVARRSGFARYPSMGWQRF